MRRQFLRIPGSPQATPFVETPAHSAPTLFNGVWLFLSEVVNGNVEPTMFLCPYTGTRLQIYEISANNHRVWTKKFNSCTKTAPRRYIVRRFFVYSQSVRTRWTTEVIRMSESGHAHRWKRWYASLRPIMRIIWTNHCPSRPTWPALCCVCMKTGTVYRWW